MTSFTKHIATRGLMQGVGSDITIEVFGKTYRLHRLILTQSKFFDSMLSGSWKEKGSDIIKLKFEDEHITQEGFEIAVERLYGVWTEEGDKNAKFRISRRTAHPETRSTTTTTTTTTAEHTISATSLSPWNALSALASGAYLGIDALCEQCTAYVIHTLSTEYISTYVQFSHYRDYYPWSGKISEACHTFLCRNGYDDPKMKCLKVFERLPAQWLLTVLGSDAFWVPNEWERYKFCRQVVHNRRKDASPSPSSPSSVYCFDTEEESVYDTLFSTCVTYMHMTFEQLQVILVDCDPITGHCFTPSDIVQEALWQQTELRTLIESSSKDDGPLNVTVSDSDVTPDNLESWEKFFWHRDVIPDQDTTLVGDTHFAPPSQPLPAADLAGTGTSDVKKRSLYAPFRFSVEFGDIHSLQDNVRICSDVVFYAG
ncbi:hypothetical protein BGZ58_010564 [Dissophora ornata]|nr:hypothetical protein BGZ58_010564 [Dissophora ornata]